VSVETAEPSDWCDMPEPGDIIPEYRAKSSRNAERHQIGMVGDIIADSRRLPLESADTRPHSEFGDAKRFGIVPLNIGEIIS